MPDIRQPFTLQTYKVETPDDENQKGRFCSVGFAVTSTWPASDIAKLFERHEACSTLLKYFYDPDGELRCPELRKFHVEPRFKKCNFSFYISRANDIDELSFETVTRSGVIHVAPRQNYHYDIAMAFTHECVPNTHTEVMAEILSLELPCQLSFSVTDLFTKTEADNNETNDGGAGSEPAD